MKRRIGNTWLRSVLTVSILALVGAGCAEEVGDIDRTQANKLKKSQLAGAWYYLQTMTDVPQQSSQGFVGNTNFGNAAKVTFEITEDWLFVLPVTETVQFAEAPYKRKKVRNFWEPGKSNEFVEMWVGEPIAAFPIEKHFDVIRGYNTSTGKQSNVIEENDSDRLWHEREYIRVNWGGNGVKDWAFPTGTYPVSSVDHFVQEGEDEYLKQVGQGENPDLPEFKEDYVSFVVKAYMAPSGTDWQGMTCNPYGVSNRDCAGSVIKVRHSFKRADVTPDVETMIYKNGEHMDKFGFFLADRYAYDELWNLTETLRDYKAQRWNMWEKTWDNYEVITTDAGEPMTCWEHTDCGTDELVLDYQAKRCIRETLYAPGTCYNSRLLPYKERGLRPIIYHLSANVPEQTIAQHYRSTEQWNDVMKDTVAWLYTLEEYDRYWTRSCSSDSDCTAGRDDVVYDATVDTPRTVAATPDATGACSGGAVAVNGECMFGVSCDTATNPCASNQVCNSGSCFWKESGSQVLNPALVNGARGITMVIANSADGVVAVPVQDDFQNPTLNGGQAIVRFVNTSGSDATLTVGGAQLGSTPSGTGWVKNAYAANAGSVTIEAGGQSVTASLTANLYHIVVLSSDGLAVSPAMQTAGDGIRFLHMVSGAGAVDAGANGIQTAQGLTFENVSDRTPVPFDEARVVVTTAGAQGDVTCYYTMHEGRCTGWAGGWTDAMQARYNEIKNSLPPMWITCQNQYDLANEASLMADAQDKYMTTYHDGRYSYAGINPYAVGGNASYDGIYNPCKEMVEEPTALKKIGDMRYNYIYWVGEAQAASPLGYGPSAGDPETGQLVWGTAYIYGAPTLTYGEASKDLVDLINGDLNEADVITGEYIRTFVEAKGDPLSPYNDDTLYYGHLDDHGRVRADQMFKRHGQFDRQGVVHPFNSTGRHTAEMHAELAEFITNKQYRQNLLRGVPTVSNTYAKDRLEKIRGTHIEDLLITEEVKRGLSGGQLTGSLAADIHEAMSPASWAHSVAHNHERHVDRNLVASAPCTYDRAFVDDNIYGMAKEFTCSDAERQQWLADPSSVPNKTCLQGDELRWEITNRILSGLIEHEVGHTMGLRHNFAGSADLFNFHDEYYEIRQPEKIYCKSNGHCDEDDGELCQFSNCSSAADCPDGLACTSGVCVDGAGENTGQCALNGEIVTKLAPRPFMTEQERLMKMSEYQYSTVMDYGGTFNSDAHGLGKYDYAAIRFAYGKLVDIYTDTSNIRGRINRLATLTGRDPSIYSYFLETEGWKNSGVLFSPFHYLEDHIGVAENLKRRTVTYDQVKYEHAMQSNYDYDSIYWSYIEVPYRFCSDEFRGNLGCYTWDTGVDVGEMVHNAIGKLNEYYIIDAFKRESMFRGDDSFVSTYFSRILSRYMAVLGDSARYLAIYDNIFGDRPWYVDFSTNIYQMGVLRRAAETSFNALAQVLATPAPGSFVQDTDGVYRNVSYDMDMAGTDLTVPVGVGKFPYTQYLSPDLYGFQNHVLFVGSFWTKLAALLTLTDSTFYSSADWVGEQLEIGRSSSVGFNTLYQTEITNLLGGIIAESLENFSYVADTADGATLSLRARDLFNPDADQGLAAVEPGLNNTTLKLYTTLYGMANLPAGFDPSFLDATTVFLKGQGHEFSLPANTQVAEFNDPFGAKTYVAYTPNYSADRIAPAYRLVQQAQQLRQQWEQATGIEQDRLASQLKEQIELLDIMREMHVIYGTLVY